MALNLGATAINGLRLGAATPSKLMLGDVQVWPVGGNLWTPADDPGLIAWFDCTDPATFIVLPDNKFSRWTAKNNPGIYMEQGDSARQTFFTGGWINPSDPPGFTTISYTPAGIPSLAGKLLAFGWNSIASSYAALCGLNIWSPAFYMIGDSSAVQVFGRGRYGDGSGFMQDQAAIASFPDFSNAGAVFYKNGTLVSGAYSGSPWPTEPPNAFFSESTAGAGNKGRVFDFIVSSSNDAATRQKAEGFIAHRAGLAAALPADHPYKTAPPTK